MSKIQVMSEALSNRIAAGEVIERPASVVKELVENAIDAGSSMISVEIERAGARLIAVTDDGCGMDAEDALLSLEPHGTSKLLAEDDLDHIMTLGFRGEAIPSIASVSRFTLTTRTADSAEGTRLICVGGAKPELSPCGGAPGTRIEVRDLFFNMPARKKFLKSAATEEHHIEEMLSLLAIGHPEIGFKLRIDSRVVFNSPASGKLEYRLRELFGKSFVERMLFFDHTEGGMHLSGCVGAPGFTRPSRRDQRVFINSRAVESQAVYRGIRDGYSVLAEPGRYNPVILFIEMAPEELDVNVHPAKREVRFRNEYSVSRAVSAAVSAALRKMRDPSAGSGVPEENALRGLPLSGKLPLSLVLDASEVRYHVPETVQPTLKGFAPARAPAPAPVPAPAPEPPPVSPQLTDRNTPQTAVAAPPPIEAEEPPVSVTTVETKKEDQEGVFQWASPLVAPGTAPAFTGDWPQDILGVLDNTYILCASRTGLVMIDQHAAHERIMFEKLLAESAKGDAPRQQLLLPETVELSRAGAALLLKNRKIFDRFGFDLESAGGRTVLINSLPVTLSSASQAAAVVTDMLDELIDNAGHAMPVAPALVARAACRAAVKAHDQLSDTELHALIEQLQHCRQGTLCPHGRPTMVSVTFKEIEHRFGRR